MHSLAKYSLIEKNILFTFTFFLFVWLFCFILFFLLLITRYTNNRKKILNNNLTYGEIIHYGHRSWTEIENIRKSLKKTFFFLILLIIKCIIVLNVIYFTIYIHSLWLKIWVYDNKIIITLIKGCCCFFKLGEKLLWRNSKKFSRVF